ncbi:MAG: alpha/beta hydrolase, partial [Thermomicrobium sp.]|nr:alpha/beta hydrolase [Thermomicrobium sp.]
EPSCIAIAGDSAGGNLVLAALLRVRDAGDPLPAVAACLSPVVDLTDSEARSRRAGDRALRPEVVALFNAAYLNGHDPRDPFVSPVYADLRGLPPLVIHAGGAELLREDAERIAAAARAAGVDVELAIYPGMGHVWQLQLDVPAARDSVREIARFVRQHLPRAA